MAGAILMQEDNLGIDKPVSFYSKKFNSYQLNYSVIEKEALALILALTFLHSLQCSNQRLIRWSLFLQSYTLDIRHVKGTENVVADALSWAPRD